MEAQRSENYCPGATQLKTGRAQLQAQTPGSTSPTTSLHGYLRLFSLYPTSVSQHFHSTP